MTIDERYLLNARIGELLHWALVRIRFFTFTSIPDEPDRREEINDLTDLLHNLPRYIVGHDENAIDSAEQLRDALVEHVRRFYPDVDPAQQTCVQLLDMDDDEFLQRYRDHQWGIPEPLSTARN